ncbi:MAG: DNA mismatch repair protein MutS [Candidatus Delongbacteria bacterium]|nr:DNA mismatch repair protein MutS [Candidatus Delongbacteria bacterium]MBN2833886.1 DNA mismatch repair protein MutS [Candidatus Delongbacteria bacterium]
MNGIEAKLTPMMRQYFDIKKQNPDHILFYRLGDFFEMFFDDAKIVSKVLNLTLTTRGKHLDEDIPLAGFPHHHLETYLPKMIKAGYKVAVCEQLEDPKDAKGVVKRGIVEIVSAGTAMSDSILDKDAPAYISTLSFDKNGAGFSIADVSSGEFIACRTETDSALKELILYFSPKEILVKEKDYSKLVEVLKNYNTVYTKIPEWQFDKDFAISEIYEYYNIKNSTTLGFEENDISLICSGTLLYHLKTNLKTDFKHLNMIKKFIPDEYVGIDDNTRRNLELIEPMRYDGDKKATLFGVLNKTQTGMGSRLLRKWILTPLKSLSEINIRLELVEYLKENAEKRSKLGRLLREVSDIERIVGKIATSRAVPPDLINLKNSLHKIPEIKEIFIEFETGKSEITDSFVDFLEVYNLINNSLIDNPPININEGNFIKNSFNSELDELRSIMSNGKDWILDLQQRIRDELDLQSVKVGFNRVFGYYFEVSRKNSDKIPDNFIRKQSLANSERFINEELKLLEEKILNAEEKINSLEKSIFLDLRENIKNFIDDIKVNSSVIAKADVFYSLALTADENRYNRPILRNDNDIEIFSGRHPVIENLLSAGDEFIPNDIKFNNSELIHIITGPNMSGKSTYLRQNALIVLMAQMGSFVPADSAVIGVVDKIFTRVGASDNLSAGESTFLVEMLESANILNNATPKSLIVLDEVGRGTSTFDGLSIAWAIVEYIHNQRSLMCRTLFATHYHELTEMELVLKSVVNYSVSVKEYGDEVIFLRKIVKGFAKSSFGIYVAKLAGLPNKVIKRANEILGNLEKNSLTPDEKPKLAQKKNSHEFQLSLFEADNDPLRDKLSAIDVNNMTPLDALNYINELKKIFDDQNKL